MEKGKFDVNTGIGFFNHMMETLSKHSMIDLTINANGDLHVDYHHLVEDTGITLAQAINQALTDKRGISRYGRQIHSFRRSFVRTALDISGRPFYRSNLTDFSGIVGDFGFELGDVFFSAFASQGFTLHLDVLTGKNLHHILEAAMKSFARTLRMAIEMDARNADDIPSTKDFIEGRKE